MKNVQPLSGNASDPQWDLSDYQLLGKRAISEDEALRAHEVASQGLQVWPGNETLLQIKALALARMGSRAAAIEILQGLRSHPTDTEQIMALLARCYKDEWLETGSLEALRSSYETYAKAYAGSADMYWAGINAATLALRLGTRDEARRIAQELLRACQQKADSVLNDEAYWVAATIAEAQLILENVADAEHWYARCAETGKQRVGDILASWANARLILSLMPAAVSLRIEAALNVPRVAVFAGHRIDGQDRGSARFPEQRTEEVKKQIRARLLQQRVRISYSSAAAGSDILFLEAVQSLGGQTHVVLPCNKEQFLEESVANSGHSWVSRFHAVLDSADEAIIVSPQRLKIGSVAYDFSNQVLYGLAARCSRQNGTGLVHVAVWDGFEGDGPGGTADIVKFWRTKTDDVTIVRPLADSTNASNAIRKEHGMTARDRNTSILGIRSEVRALLFADAYHFSHLSEEQVVAFIEHFMSPVAMLIQQTYPAPLLQNTWGDGLYLVFRDVRDAGEFALKLQNRLSLIDRERTGLPKDLVLRIALHAGPIYVYKDEIINRPNYIGSHVNRTARIEPVTPPGQIYVTDAFAALSEIHAPGQFQFTYVGKTPLAKDYGDVALYAMTASASR